MAGLVAGVDLGGTKIQAVIVADEQVVGQARCSTPATAAEVVDAIASMVRGAVEAAAAAPSDLDGVGIGSPGIVVEGEVLGAANLPGFGSRFPLAAAVASALDGPRVMLDNDVRVAVMGEMQRGAGRPYRDLLGVFVGTGVGGGVVLGGEIRRGRGSAGEIGHTVVLPGGRMCGCGRRGCLEAYAGRASMEVAARRAQERGRATQLFRIQAQRGRPRLTSGVFARALAAGDSVAAELIDAAVWALGAALASAHNLLDVEAILLGGGLADRLGQPFVDRVAAAMTPHVFNTERPPVVLPTGLGDLSGAVGAAVLAGG